jgi:hypothetical protein
MRDYFAEFLLNPKAASAASAVKARVNSLQGLGNETKTPLKLHVAWALVATGIGVLSWKASKVYSGYKFLKSKTES